MNHYEFIDNLQFYIAHAYNDSGRNTMKIKEIVNWETSVANPAMVAQWLANPTLI
jgi:hypothetical protein